LESWKVEKLGDVCDVLDSKRKPITKRDRIAGEYPYYGATGILDYVYEYIFDEKLVLIGEDGAKWESGEYTAFIATGKYWVNNHAHVIRPNRSVVLDEWLVYYLYVTDLKKFVTGLTVPKLNQEKMREIPIPIPPLPEQQRIVALLDETFAALEQVHANAERNLVNAREVFEAEMEVVFTSKESTKWDERSLIEVCEKIQDGAHNSPKVTYPEKRKNTFMYITSKNIRNDYMDLSKVDYVDESFHQSIYPRCNVEFGDVLLTKDGANTGNVTLNTIHEPFSTLSSVCLIKTKRQVLMPAFLKYYIRSTVGFKNITGQMAGAAIKRIVLHKIKSSRVPLPPLEEQRAIVQRLDALAGETQRLEAVYQSKLEAVEELRKSVLGKAFEGEL